jgi:dienelactone hydrolase
MARALAAALVAAASIGLAVVARSQPARVAPESAAAAVPSPLGPFAVGTRRLTVVDRSRRDPLEVTAGGREVALQIWYPTDAGGPRSPYAPAAVSRAIAQRERLPARALMFRANAHVGAAVAPGRFPVAIFSPGYGMTAYSYTALLEDLASNGYIVVGITHIGDAVAAPGAKGQLRRAVLPADAGRLRPGLLARDIAARVGDVRYVIASLSRLAARAHLAGSLDGGRIGVFGHSLGGLTASHVTGTAGRVDCAANLAGSVFAVPRLARFTKPYLLMTGKKADATLAAFWRRQRGPRWWLSLERALHLDFSDWAWLTGQLAHGGLRPQAARQVRLADEATVIERHYLRSFFARCLKRQNDGLLDAPPPYPGVSIRR